MVKENKTSSSGDGAVVTKKNPPRPRYRCPISWPFSDDAERLTLKLYSLVHKSHIETRAKWAKKGKKRGVEKGIREITKTLRLASKDPKKAEELRECLILLGADTSPIDVLSHVPVLCERASIPYIWVPCRRRLGSSAGCRRPASIVLLRPTEQIARSLGKCRKVISRLVSEAEVQSAAA